MSEMLLHITTRSTWGDAQEQGFYTAPRLSTEEFIHFSRVSQVLEVAHFFYRGRRDLVLLCVQPDKLGAELRYEALETPEAYPHLYGPLELEALTRTLEFPPKPDGTFQLPAELGELV
jgi:uncharacterized protein (DUF952 family)